MYSSRDLRASIKYDGSVVLDLHGKGLFRVPDAVTDLSEVEKLRLDRNNLTGLPTSIHKLENLVRLDLDGNKLAQLPAEIGHLKKLKVLNVSNI